MGLIERNREQIEKLILYQDKLLRNTNGHPNMQEMQGKPDSEPPIPDAGLDWSTDADNAYAAKFVEPLIRGLKGKYYAGEDLYSVVCEAGYREPDHSALKRWRAGNTSEDRRKAQAFDAATRLVAQVLYHQHPQMRLVVRVRPEEEQASSRMEARDQDRRMDAHGAYRILAPLVQERMEEGYSKTAAVESVAEGMDTSPARVWRAVAFVEEESA